MLWTAPSSAAHFNGPLSPKVIVKFTTTRLNFSIFPTPGLYHGKGLLLFLPYEVKNDQRSGEMRFSTCTPEVL